MDPSDRRDRAGGAAETPAEALARARRHARAAGAEATAALGALLDAASLAATGTPGSETLPPLAGGLEAVARLLAEDAGASGAELVAGVLDALEGEIARWERRAQEDPEARAVLRAFLGLREILWELGVRAPRQPAPTATPGERPVERRKPRKTRLQRVSVEG